MSNHVARRNSDSGEDSPSSFTPVNGRGEQPHTNGLHDDSSPDDVSPNGEPYTAPSSADNSPGSSPHLRQSNGPGAVKGENSLHIHTSPPPQESVEQAHKRKRSSSTETNSYSAHAQYDYSPPKRAEHQHMAEGALQALGDTDRHTQPHHPHQTHSGHHAKDSQTKPWQGAPSQYVQLQNGGGPMNLSEARLATALQQATQQESGSPHTQQTVRETSSVDGYGQDQTGSGQSGNKRKRQFANRTKTGCKTCRQRKKKCDEGQPYCQNCQRGGFSCLGYTNSSTFSRPVYGKSPVPLQSKDGEHVNGSDGTNGYHINNSPPDTKRPSMHGELSQSRTITIEDGDGHGQYTASPQSAEPRMRSMHPGQPWAQPGPYAGQPSHGPDRLPSFSALSKGEGQKQDYGPSQQQYRQHPPNMSQQQQQPPHGPPPPPQATSQWHPPPPPPQQPRQEYRQYPPQIETSYAPPTPHHQRMSSTYDPVKSGPRTFMKEEIEKSKMLRGANFNYFDATLTNERQRCEAALTRYNQASQILSGLTDVEKFKLLEKVVDPSKDTTHNFIVPCTEKGEIGPNVKVEAPFTASYGYNLRLEDDVCIHHHCNIDDAASVHIGPRTWIGPNVTIITTDVRNQMQDRRGVLGSWVAQPVEIGTEAYIGANVTIYPGVTIGRGATICHGATVTENIMDNERLKANGQKSFD